VNNVVFLCYVHLFEFEQEESQRGIYID